MSTQRNLHSWNVSKAVNNGDPRMKTLKFDILPDLSIPHISQLKESVGRPIDFAVAVIGFPSDEGTVRNGGRPGGITGPSAFRRFCKLIHLFICLLLQCISINLIVSVSRSFI
jgi:hypothetical protein